MIAKAVSVDGRENNLNKHSVTQTLRDNAKSTHAVKHTSKPADGASETHKQTCQRVSHTNTLKSRVQRDTNTVAEPSRTTKDKKNASGRVRLK